MDEGAIIDLYVARSEQAIAATAAKYGAYCYTISYNILHSREDADECVNDTYRKVKQTNRHRNYVGIDEVRTKDCTDRKNDRNAEDDGTGKESKRNEETEQRGRKPIENVTCQTF